jgi:hypothetical protein
MPLTAVFIHAVRTRPENAGKTLEAIEWEKYPLGLGETLELCAGLMVRGQWQQLIYPTF